MWTTNKPVYDLDCVLADASIGLTTDINNFIKLVLSRTVIESLGTVVNLDVNMWVCN